MSGYINNGAIGQIHHLLERRTPALDRILGRSSSRVEIQQALPARTGHRRCRRPIRRAASRSRSAMSSQARRPIRAHRRPRHSPRLQQTPGVDRRDDVELRSIRRRSKWTSIANARARSTRASARRQRRCAPRFGGDTATQFTGPDGLKDVQVIYPATGPDQPRPASRRFRSARTTARSSASATSSNLQDVPAPPLIIRIDRRNVVLHRRQRRAGRNALERHARLTSGACARCTFPRTSRSRRWPAAIREQVADTIYRDEDLAAALDPARLSVDGGALQRLRHAVHHHVHRAGCGRRRARRARA